MQIRVGQQWRGYSLNAKNNFEFERAACPMARASHSETAQRLNLARILLRQSASFARAVHKLARLCVISPRHAYRYLHQAEQMRALLRGPRTGGRLPVAGFYGSGSPSGVSISL